MAKKGGAAVIKRSFLERLVQIVIGGIFAVLPLLYFSGRAASYVTSKEYFFIGAVGLLTVLWGWLLLNDHRYRLTKKNVLFLLPAVMLLASLTVSAIVGVDPATSFFSTVESGTGLLLLYHVLLFTVILASIIRVQQKKILTGIIQANLFASVVLAIFTFFTGVNGVVQTNSKMLNGSSGGAMMGNSLLVGSYFVFSVFLTIVLIAQEQKMYKKILYYLGIGIIVLSPIYFNVGIWKGVKLSSSYLFLGEARIAAIAVIAGLLFSLFLWLSLRKGKRSMQAIGLVGLIIGVLIAGFAIKDIASPTTTLHQFFVTEGGNRTIDWQEAVQGIKDRPLLGWGPENYHVVYQKYLNPIVFSPGHGNEVWALHPHNNTLEVLINGGIIGFVCYLFVLAGIIIGLSQLYKKNVFDAKTTALFAGMLVAFFIQQQMIYDSIVSYVMFFFVIAVIAGFSSTNNDHKPFVSNTTQIYIIGMMILVVMFPVWLYCAYLPARKVEEFQTVADAHSDARAGMYQHLFHSPGSYAVDTDVEFYTDPLFFSYQSQEAAIKQNPLYQKVASQELNALFAAVVPVWITKPYDYHLTLSLVQLENLQFYLTGDKAQLAHADIYAKRAFVLSPTDPQIYFSYAQTLVYEGKTNEAKTMLDKAISLNANYQSAVDFRKVLQ